MIPLWLAVLTLFRAAPVRAEVNRIVLRVNDRIATLYDYEKLRREEVRNLVLKGVLPRSDDDAEY